MKRTSLRIATVAALIVAGALLGAYFRGRARAERRYPLAIDAASSLGDGEALDRGGHLARSIAGCADCHAADFGGQVLEDGPVMTLVAPNLTRGLGGLGEAYTYRDHVRAIVRGVDRRGRPLLVMPSDELAKLSDDDVGAIAAFIGSLPPVDRTLPRSRLSLLGTMMSGVIDMPVFAAERLPRVRRSRARRPHGVTREHGDYLVALCRGCHGADLRGGITHAPGTPPSADISARAMRRYTKEQFVRVLREGVRPDGTRVSDAMPWQATRGMSDVEIDAIWLSLRAAP